jgi:putative colanic acid biosynthesis glycosyltransferase
MKVLQINTVYQFGSTGRIVKYIKDLCAKEGIDSYAVYGDSAGLGLNDYRIICVQNQLLRKWNILKCRIWPKHGFYNVTETKRLIKFMEEIKPDIIHLHNIHNHYVNVDMLFDYIKSKNIPVVWTFHDCWPFTGWCAYFDYAQCDKWKIQCYQCPCKHDYPFTFFFDLSKSNFLRKKNCFSGVKNMTIVSPSKWLADLTKQSFLRNYSVKVINNGIDLSVFKPTQSDVKQRLGIADKKMILAMAMHIGKRKGLMYLLCLREMLNENERLVLVGVTSEEKAKYDSEHCVCVKRTSNLMNLAEYYSAADVFINPTLEDNFPTTNIESLACGTPIVTFDTGGSVEPVDDETGLVVPKGDLVGLLSAIRKVLLNGNKKYAGACVEKARSCYDKDKKFKEYIDLYKEIYNNRK